MKCALVIELEVHYCIKKDVCKFIDYLKVTFDWGSSNTVMTPCILGNSHNGGMGKSLASQWGNLSIMGRYFLSSVSGLNPISGLTGSDIFIPA